MKVRGLVGMVLVRERIWVMHDYKSSNTEGGLRVHFMLTLLVKFTVQHNICFFLNAGFSLLHFLIFSTDELFL